MTQIETSFELTPLQEGMLFNYLSAPHSGVEIEHVVVRVQEEIDVSIFCDAWQLAVQRHLALRTAFRWEDCEKPIQEVWQHSEIEVLFHDWSEFPASEIESKFDEFLQALSQQGFDLTHAPLSRVSVVRISESEQRIVWTCAHIIVDGYSFSLVLRDVFSYYKSLQIGEKVQVDSQNTNFRDFGEWLDQRDKKADEDFWKNELNGFLEPTPLPAARHLVDEAPAGDRRKCSLRLSETTTTSLRALAENNEFTLNTLVQGAWAILLSRYTGSEDIVFGAVRRGRVTAIPGAKDVVGPYINTIPVRAQFSADINLIDWLVELRQRQIAMRPHEHAALVDIHSWSEIPGSTNLFESLLLFDSESIDSQFKSIDEDWANRKSWLVEHPAYPLTLYAYGDPELLLEIAHEETRISDSAARQILNHVKALLESMAKNPDSQINNLSMLSEADRHRQLIEWNDTGADFPRDRCIHEIFQDQVLNTPDRVAARYKDQSLTYDELNKRANRLAAHLRNLGVGPDVLVAIFTGRSIEMLVSVLGVLKAGGAYVPIDSDYPANRISLMIEDAKVSILLTQAEFLNRLPASDAQVVLVDSGREIYSEESDTNLGRTSSVDDLAYVIYTSGSTGKPKGVMIEHRNVINFFAGMDKEVPHDSQGVWLAVTSLSFDISVLELLWTLARGFEVVIYGEHDRRPAVAASVKKPIDLGLFYFASGDTREEQESNYRLFMEGARFADANGFSAVWSPERHFHAFGGLYPNPSVAGAVIAGITKNISIRAGSVVLPLHHPLRIAEDWALVDNFSNGRVGISFATGWHPNDFVLAPDRYANRKDEFYDGIKTVQALWRGESVQFPNPNGEQVEIQTLPRPVQPELPVWVTTAGNVETYRSAGESGANLLTHLLGQTIEEVRDKIRVYREARAASGHEGEGCVSLMLHTFVGDDDEAVREKVRQPMINYLGSSMALVKNYAAEWTAFSNRSEASGDEFTSLSEGDREALLEYSFDRYYETSALFGTEARCVEFLGEIAGIGVDEIACLIDFGVDADEVLEHLPKLAEVRAAVAANTIDESDEYSVGSLIRRHGVTHIQCTPSMARMFIADSEVRDSLSSIQALLIGGEAFPGDLAGELAELGPVKITNMYGPTETTIWSSTHSVAETSGIVPIGRPIANTQLYVLDPNMNVVPVGVAGELYIGGDGVARGYFERQELTAECFVENPHVNSPDSRMYRTGDLARYLDDGVLEFLGRVDHQVKVRGHRIELGEIESVLVQHPALKAVVVVAFDEGNGNARLTAYIIPLAGISPSIEELKQLAVDKLPEFMVPELFVELSEFPLTPNGKVDRNALPKPEPVKLERKDAQTDPRTPIEETLVQIWGEVLNVNPVGVQDSFFDLGGNSLSTIQICSRIRQELNVDLQLRSIFRSPTVEGVAQEVENLILEQVDDASLEELLKEIETDL